MVGRQKKRNWNFFLEEGEIGFYLAFSWGILPQNIPLILVPLDLRFFPLIFQFDFFVSNDFSMGCFQFSPLIFLIAFGSHNFSPHQKSGACARMLREIGSSLDTSS